MRFIDVLEALRETLGREPCFAEKMVALRIAADAHRAPSTLERVRRVVAS